MADWLPEFQRTFGFLGPAAFFSLTRPKGRLPFHSVQRSWLMDSFPNAGCDVLCHGHLRMPLRLCDLTSLSPKAVL